MSIFTNSLTNTKETCQLQKYLFWFSFIKFHLVSRRWGGVIFTSCFWTVQGWEMASTQETMTNVSSRRLAAVQSSVPRQMWHQELGDTGRQRALRNKQNHGGHRHSTGPASRSAVQTTHCPRLDTTWSGQRVRTPGQHSRKEQERTGHEPDWNVSPSADGEGDAGGARRGARSELISNRNRAPARPSSEPPGL